MKINITQIISRSIVGAIPQYKKGSRVIVNFGTTKDPEYYVGTVTGIRKGLVYVLFDDGDKGSYKPTPSKVGLVGITKKKTGRKSEIPAKDIDKWLSIDIGKSKPKRKSKTNTITKKHSEVKELGYMDQIAKEYAGGKSMAKLQRENQEVFYRDTSRVDKWTVEEVKRIAVSKFGMKKKESKALKDFNKTKPGSHEREAVMRRNMENLLRRTGKANPFL